MTRTLLSVVLLLLALSVFAQQYDFAPVGARWTYSVTSPIPGDNSVFAHEVVVESEEIFQGQLCRKLTGIVGEGLPNPLYAYSQNDSVFFYSELSENFELLYDFGAVPGETWTIRGINGPDNTDSLTIEIDATYPLILEDTTLQVFEVRFELLPFEWGTQIIRGIGSDFFHLPYSFELVLVNRLVELRCYSDGQHTFQFEPFPCDTNFIVSTHREPENSGPTVSVFPNPAANLLMVLWEGQPGRLALSLYNLRGQVVRQEVFCTRTNEFDLSGLPPGIYFWEAVNESGHRRSGKVVKARD